MDGENEQRVVIKCCFKAGVSATETLVFYRTVYKYIPPVLRVHLKPLWLATHTQRTAEIMFPCITSNIHYTEECFKQTVVNTNEIYVLWHAPTANDDDGENGYKLNWILCKVRVNFLGAMLSKIKFTTYPSNIKRYWKVKHISEISKRTDTSCHNSSYTYTRLAKLAETSSGPAFTLHSCTGGGTHNFSLSWVHRYSEEKLMSPIINMIMPTLLNIICATGHFPQLLFGT